MINALLSIDEYYYKQLTILNIYYKKLNSINSAQKEFNMKKNICHLNGQAIPLQGIPYWIGEKVKRILMFFIVIVVVNTVVSTQTFGHSSTSPPTLISESAIVIEANTGKVLYEKDPLAKMYPASLTKIATAIYAIEKGDIEKQ